MILASIVAFFSFMLIFDYAFLMSRKATNKREERFWEFSQVFSLACMGMYVVIFFLSIS